MTRALPRAVELHDLTKSFGDVLAVDEVSAVTLPGEVTALLGPNGAGKTTTLRMLLGLVAPSSGTTTFGGRRYDELTDPVRRVGAVLEASGCHPGRTALDHLRVLVTASRLPKDAPMRVLALFIAFYASFAVQQFAEPRGVAAIPGQAADYAGIPQNALLAVVTGVVFRFLSRQQRPNQVLQIAGATAFATAAVCGVLTVTGLLPGVSAVTVGAVLAATVRLLAIAGHPPIPETAATAHRKEA